MKEPFLAGAIFNARFFAPHYWWLEFTTGIEHQKDKIRGTQNFNISRTGLDDIVVAGGKNFLFHDETGANCALRHHGIPYAVAGNSPRKFWSISWYPFFGLGAGAELSYSFIRSLKQALNGILQVRAVHFFWPEMAPHFTVWFLHSTRKFNWYFSDCAIASCA